MNGSTTPRTHCIYHTVLERNLEEGTSKFYQEHWNHSYYALAVHVLYMYDSNASAISLIIAIERVHLCPSL